MGHGTYGSELWKTDEGYVELKSAAPMPGINPLRPSDRSGQVQALHFP